MIRLREAEKRVYGIVGSGKCLRATCPKCPQEFVAGDPKMTQADMAMAVELHIRVSHPVRVVLKATKRTVTWRKKPVVKDAIVSSITRRIYPLKEERK